MSLDVLRGLLKSIGRGLKRGVSNLGLAALLIPVAGLAVLPVFDQGPGGRWRGSIFTIGLTLWDPSVWNAAASSVGTAVVVLLASGFVGVRLGRSLGEGPFWGRPLLGWLVLSPLAAGPLVTCLGLREFLAGHPVDLSSTNLPGGLTLATLPIEQALRWLALTWAEVLRGSAVVAIATAEALRRVDPLWVDAAESVGARRQSAWRPLIWPVVRPDVLRSQAAIFTWVLFDPTASLIFGLDSTLPSQAVRALLRESDLPRAAVLATVAVVLASIGRSWIVPRQEDATATARTPHPRPLTPGQAFARLLTLCLWTAIAIAPIGLGIRSVLSLVEPDGDWLDLLAVLLRSLGPALAGVLIALCLARGIGSTASGWWPARVARLAGRIGRWPALAIAVGVAGLPWLCLLLNDVLSGTRFGVRTGWLADLATILHPVRNPWLLFGWGVALSRIGLAFELEVDRRDRHELAWEQAAVLLGARASQARRIARRFPWSGLRISAVAWIVAVAATDLAMPLVLSPATGGQPVGPRLLNDATSTSSAATPGLWCLLILAVRIPAFYAALVSARSISLRPGTSGAGRGFIG